MERGVPGVRVAVVLSEDGVRVRSRLVGPEVAKDCWKQESGSRKWMVRGGDEEVLEIEGLKDLGTGARSRACLGSLGFEEDKAIGGEKVKE